MSVEDELLAQIKRLTKELDARAVRHRKLRPYFRCTERGRAPIPAVIEKAKMVNAYRDIMSMSETPWGKTIVNAKLDRLEVTGIGSPDKEANEAVWGLWQDNAMDLESKLAHTAALTDGRAHAIVWPDRNGVPRISLDDITQTIIQFEEGSRRDRAAALRRWVDFDEREHVTIYRPEGLYKFTRREVKRQGESEWVRRETKGEPWPLPNPLRVVNAVEIAVNRELAPGVFTLAWGEYEDVTGLMDRINLLTFLGLVVAIWMGFPLRGVLGEKILKDDDGNQIPPFESRPDSVFQFENPEAEIAEFKAADRKNLSVFAELTELASATSTPRHYLPMEGSISNVSEATIRAFEGGMHATVNASHKPSLGEGWEEVLRLGGKMLEKPVQLSARAELQWADHESRSLGERADAALKLNQTGLPWQAVADIALNLGQDQIRQYEAQHAGSAITKLLAEVRTPPPVSVPAANGNGSPA